MFEFLIGILALGIGLFIWVAIGHAIWVAFAALFRKAKTPVLAEPPQVFTRESDLQAAAEVINRLRRGQVLSEEAYQSTRDALELAATKYLVALESKLPASTLPPILPPAVGSSNTNAPVVPALLLPQKETPVEVTPVAPLHPLAQEYTEPAKRSTPAVATQRALGELLAQFLSEKNIQWGELLSGLLIVGSAVGLILSLRSELNRIIPMFPAVLFFLVTVAIHLAGFYTLKRWKLPSTSRGLLWIGTLMMPITGLAACLLADHQGSVRLLDTSFLVPMIGGGLIFLWLGYLTGKSLSVAQPWRWCLAAVPATLMLGLINRSLEPPISINTIALLTLGGWSGMTGIALLLLKQSYSRRDPWRMESLPSELRLIGTALIAAMITSAFLWFRAHRELSSSLPWAMPSAMGSLLIGVLSLYLGNRCQRATPEERLGHRRWLDVAWLISNSGQLLSMFGLVISMACALPNARLFYGLGLVETLLLVAMACLHRTPVWTFISTCIASLAGWMVWHVAWDGLPPGPMTLAWALQHLQSISTAYFALAASTILGILGGWLGRANMRSSVLDGHNAIGKFGWLDELTHARCVFLVAGLHMTVALFIAFHIGIWFDGVSNLAQACLIMSLYAVGLMVIARQTDHTLFTLAASGLLLVLAMVGIRPDGWLGQWIELSKVPVELKLGMMFLAHSLMALGCWSVLIWVPGRKSGKQEEAAGDQGSLGLTTSSMSRSIRASSFSRSLALTGSTTVTLGLVGAIWWLGIGWLGTQGACCGLVVLVAMAFRWILGDMPGARALQSLALAAAGLCFVNGTLARYPVLISEWGNFSVAYSLLMSLCLGLLGIAAGWFCHRSYRWLVGGYWIVLLFQQSFLWMHVSDFNPLRLFPAYSVILPFVIPTATMLWLSVRRHRGYRFGAGLLSVPAMGVTLMALFPMGGDSESFLYCLIATPIGIAFLFACYELWIGRTSQELEKPREAIYEGLMIALGLAVLSILWIVQYAQVTNRFLGSDAAGLSLPAGAIMGGLTVLLIFARIPLTTPWLGVMLGYGVTLLGFLHSPLIHQRLEQVVWKESTFTLVMLGTVVAHAACWTAMSLRGNILYRMATRLLGPTLMQSSEAWKRHSLSMGLLCAGIAVSLATFAALVCFDPVDVRIIAFIVIVANSVFGMLSVSNDERYRTNRMLASSSLGLWCLFAILMAWSGIEEGTGMLVWANRIVRMTSMVIGATVTVTVIQFWSSRHKALIELDRQQLGLDAESESPTKSPSMWIQSLDGTWKILSIISICLIFATLVCLGPSSKDRGHPELASEIILLAVTMGCWVLVLIVDSIHAYGNVAKWPHPQRQRYVYMAQIVVGMIGVLLAVSFPHWFRWKIREYWPLVALLIALTVQWLSHYLRKRNIETIGEPLENLALALPVATAFGVLGFSTAFDPEFILALVSLYYFVLSATKASSRWAMVGGAIANVALVLFWRRFPELDFTKHPQLWMIPPAISLLIASHLQRKRLNVESVMAIRYLALFMAFLSSTGEILLQGFGKELWPPMILMVLSLGAAILGMMLQVRSYLYTGSTFLLMAIIAMVAHAQQSLQHTWPWWALGISLGVGILVLFAYFEKNKEKFQQLANRLRTWEG